MSIAVFALPLAAACCFLGVALWMRKGKHQDADVLTPAGPRPMIFGIFTPALAWMLPCSQRARRRLQKFVRTSGRYHRQALDEFLALRNVLSVGWLLLVATAFAVLSEPGEGITLPWLLLGGLGAVLIFALPRLFLESMAKGRLHRIERGLPDALDMIGMCMAGGLPLPESLTRVSEELHGTHTDLAFELRIVGRQMMAGSLGGALQKFADRIDTPDVQSLAALVGQTEHQGASVAQAFQDFADNVREERRQRADELGNKTAVKMLFPVVLCLAPPVYVMLMAPAIIEIRNFIQRENQPGGALSATENAFSDMNATLDDLPETTPLTSPDNRP